MGHVVYDPVANAVLADVQIVPAFAVAEGVYDCNGFDVDAPRGLFGGIDIYSGDFTMYMQM